MSLILNIDTSLEQAAVCLSKDGAVLASLYNEAQKDHAAWLHPAIHELLAQTSYRLQDLQAIAVCAGPGSYTGLRVGMASAKGFCYALDIPLITVGTLAVMADSVKAEATDLICPMIDARRMEVFAAIYEKNTVEKIPPFSTILDNNSFTELLSSHQILFCGNGTKKLQSLLTHPHAGFARTGNLMDSLAYISHKLYNGNKFAVLAYTEPLYVKEVYTQMRKN